MNTDRKYASVQKVISINPIPGADRIESVGVLGWECVASKGAFKVGDLCVYYELDSFLPIRPEFEVLRDNSYKHSDLMGEGFRIKTQTFRGKLSQGFITDLSILPSGNYTEGQDVSKMLGVRGWDREEERDSFGTIIADTPAFIKKTNEYRVQSFPGVVEELHGKAYYITNKVDGHSTTIFCNDGVVGVCGHDTQYETETYKYLNEIRHIIEVCKQYGDIAIQGEIAGPGIIKNRGGFKNVTFFAFNIVDTKTRRLFDYDEFIKFCAENGIKTVEVVEEGDYFDYTTEELIEKADGVYKETGKRREGIVIRPKYPEHSTTLSDRLSFKVINNKYLLKSKD